jgi:hypothetical protein
MKDIIYPKQLFCLFAYRDRKIYTTTRPEQSWGRRLSLTGLSHQKKNKAERIIMMKTTYISFISEQIKCYIISQMLRSIYKILIEDKGSEFER